MTQPLTRTRVSLVYVWCRRPSFPTHTAVCTGTATTQPQLVNAYLARQLPACLNTLHLLRQPSALLSRSAARRWCILPTSAASSSRLALHVLPPNLVFVALPGTGDSKATRDGNGQRTGWQQSQLGDPTLFELLPPGRAEEPPR